MRDSLYLAWQYLRRNKWTTVVLVAALTLIFFLPAALLTVVDDAAQHLRSRAVATPLIVGSRGSPLELVLATLYFDEPTPAIMQMSELDRLKKSERDAAIPLHTAIRTRDTAIVGTSPDYFDLRNLRLDRGRSLAVLGECLVGWRAAERLDLDLGSKLPVANQKAFALQDAPLRLNVAGVLAPTETPDDDAIFVDLKTVWILEGWGHGHAPKAKHGTAAAQEYTDITLDNEGSFHFHGDQSQFPITAIIVQPQNAKARAMLLGEYLSTKDAAQIVRPQLVMDALLTKILMVRSYVIAIVSLVSLVTLAVVALVIALSIRLRRGEITTMTKIGCSRFAIAGVLGCQVAIILACSLLAAAAMTLLAAAFGHELVRMLVF
ncbi:MAG: ABC transporter permease [Bythopirellula sp.]